MTELDLPDERGCEDLRRQMVLQVQEAESRRREDYAEAKADGVPALRRLVSVGQGYSGQSHHVRCFLLGLFNAPEWPFELHRLRALDAGIARDALAVLRLDTHARLEIHEYLDSGEAVFVDFWAREQGADEEL